MKANAPAPVSGVVPVGGEITGLVLTAGVGVAEVVGVGVGDVLASAN